MPEDLPTPKKSLKQIEKEQNMDLKKNNSIFNTNLSKSNYKMVKLTLDK